jgi:hypothetical protein
MARLGWFRLYTEARTDKKLASIASGSTCFATPQIKSSAA